MKQATQVYLEYGAYIKELRTERNEKIKESLKTQFVNVKNKVGTFSKQQVKKFKKNIKDIDLKMKQGFLNVQEKVVKSQIKITKKVNRFKKNVIVKVNSTKKKIGKFNKQQIKKFKKRVKTAEKKIKSTKIKVVKKVNRFKKNVTVKVNSTKKKIGKFNKRQIKKFKQNIKDIDLNMKQSFLNAQEKAVNAQIKVVEKVNRFKKNVVVKVNSAKTKVGNFKRHQIKKIKNTFMSSDMIRMQKQEQIERRKQKIEELKQYRNQLMHSMNYEVSAGRSRGIFYIWTFALVGVISMFTLILLKFIIK